jgi:predicted  nucleic acid-binding Zn-ribbon protein|tara:strand:+ start:675 stop:854 length:180 start_codon:yes stop_codon:yes gene_type:complete
MQDKANKNELKLLRAQIGNLEVQVADYQQIVKELTEKIQKYEKKYGSVFTISSNYTQTE